MLVESTILRIAPEIVLHTTLNRPNILKLTLTVVYLVFYSSSYAYDV